MQKEKTITTERRCKHRLSIGDYPKQCPNCMKMVLDGNSFLGGDRRNPMRGVRQICQNIHDTTFATPDGKFLIHVDYETASEENHRRDEFNKDHIDHYFRTTDKIKSVSVEAL